MHANKITWYLNELVEAFLTMVKRKQIGPSFLFIDALDECVEKEIRPVVSFLQDLSILSSREHPLAFVYLAVIIQPSQ